MRKEGAQEHQTLEFENLPLLRTEFSLHFAQPYSFSLDDLAILRQEFKEELPYVTDFSGPGNGFNVSFGQGMGAGFDNLENGVGLAVREGQIFVAWQKLRPQMEYVRFTKLCPLLLKAWEFLEQRKIPIQKVVGFYANLVPNGSGQAAHFVRKEIFPSLPDANSSVAKEIRAGWELEGGYYRLNTYTVQEGEMIETLFAANCSNNPQHTLEYVHNELNRLFELVITEEAKDVWKLKRS